MNKFWLATVVATIQKHEARVCGLHPVVYLINEWMGPSTQRKYLEMKKLDTVVSLLLIM
jgi:hypothetical protein